MKDGPIRYSNAEDCVEDTLRRVGKQINLATPLGIGKANHLVNEFYRRACQDPSIELRIFTALSLGQPRWETDLERRFIEPLAERLFGGYPELEYIDPVKNEELPENIEVREFYFQPGSFVDSPLAQQHYVSSNYTHVVRDLMDAGVNVLAQLVGKEQNGGATRYNLSSNTDLTLDLMPLLQEAKRNGQQVETLAQVNTNLPFMYGDAVVEPGYFDAIVEAPSCEFPLFGAPNPPVSTTDYLIALGVSALIPDGGTLQIGIGSLGDAVTSMLKLRHEENERYQALLEGAGLREQYGGIVGRLGETEPFDEGLYASSEMLVDGFLELYRSGILKRKVYDHAGIQRLLNEQRLQEEVSPEMLDTLVDAEVVSQQLRAKDVALLQRFGVLRPELTYEDESLILEDGTRVPADLSDSQAKETLLQRGLGDRLQGGHVAHACFFLGPSSFYESLRSMEPSERKQICMTAISYVNKLYGQEGLKRAQRKEARFINSGLIATLSGAVASDGFEDGRVLSGVGGQYNFVAMAHELEGGRSILMIPSTREKGGSVSSNIRFNYGHTTIPRHLRDVVVTEYGIADLRGRTDEEVATSLIEIADSRYQDDLLKKAKQAGKVSQSYQIPDHARNNRPERLEKVLASHRDEGHFERFPFGTDLTEEELVLKRALSSLKQTLTKELSLPGPEAIRKTVSVPESAGPYLERMQLDDPQNAKEVLMQRAVVYALSSIDAL